MFGVGLHFSLEDLLSVRAIALPGAIVQIAIATFLGFGLALLMGWTVGAALEQLVRVRSANDSTHRALALVLSRFP